MRRKLYLSTTLLPLKGFCVKYNLKWTQSSKNLSWLQNVKNVQIFPFVDFNGCSMKYFLFKIVDFNGCSLYTTEVLSV